MISLGQQSPSDPPNEPDKKVRVTQMVEAILLSLHVSHILNVFCTHVEDLCAASPSPQVTGRGLCTLQTSCPGHHSSGKEESFG